MHHSHLHFGHHHSGRGERARGRERGSSELRQAWRDLKIALLAQVKRPAEAEERLIGILNRATAEILGR